MLPPEEELAAPVEEALDELVPVPDDVAALDVVDALFDVVEEPLVDAVEIDADALVLLVLDELFERAPPAPVVELPPSQDAPSAAQANAPPRSTNRRFDVAFNGSMIAEGRDYFGALLTVFPPRSSQ